MSEKKRARKPAKKSAKKARKPRQKKAEATRKRARKGGEKAAKKVTVRLPPQPPPGTPVIPCDDALVGQEFSVRECREKPKRGGGTKRVCDTQRVVVVGCATPSADHPKRKQLFAVQSGQRFNVPDREIRRDLRDAQKVRERYGDAPPQLPAGPSCDDLRETVLAGGDVPPSAYKRCRDLPDHVPPAGGGDTSFDFGEAPGGMDDNPYNLYSMPGRDEATRAIAEAIRDPSVDDGAFAAVLDKWSRFGARDTDAIHAIFDDFRSVRGRAFDGSKRNGYGYVGKNIRAAATGHPALQRAPQGSFKSNHHDGHHAPGDPLGIYMPPIEQWQRDRVGPNTWEWIHPQLGWSFVVRFVSMVDGYVATVSTTNNRYAYHRVVTAKDRGPVQLPIYAGRITAAKGLRSWQDGYRALRGWYASVRPGQADDRAQREREFSAGSLQRAVDQRRQMESRAASEEQWRRGMIEAGNKHFHDYTVHEHGVATKANGHGAAFPMPRMSFPKSNGLAASRGTFTILRGRNVVATVDASGRDHAMRAFLDANPHVDPSRYHAVLVSSHKPNPPKGLAPGQTYTDRRADPLLHQRVSGDGYAGEVRTRAVGCDPKVPSHIVGGKVLPRSKVAAGVRREEIRLGLRPPPVRRERPVLAPAPQAYAPQPAVVHEVYAEPAPQAYAPQEVYVQPAPQAYAPQPAVVHEAYAEPVPTASPGGLSDEDLVAMFSDAMRR